MIVIWLGLPSHTRSQMNSPSGRNAVFCCLRYHVAIDEFLLVTRRYISSVVFSSVDDVALNMAQLILELMAAVRSGASRFSSDEFLSSDVSAMIEWCCLSPF